MGEPIKLSRALLLVAAATRRGLIAAVFNIFHAILIDFLDADVSPKKYTIRI
jgi:hypothetical protein